jgi:hypothetical protein
VQDETVCCVLPYICSGPKVRLSIHLMWCLYNAWCRCQCYGHFSRKLVTCYFEEWQAKLPALMGARLCSPRHNTQGSLLHIKIPKVGTCFLLWDHVDMILPSYLVKTVTLCLMRSLYTSQSKPQHRDTLPSAWCWCYFLSAFYKHPAQLSHNMVGHSKVLLALQLKMSWRQHGRKPGVIPSVDRQHMYLLSMAYISMRCRR